MLSRSLVEYSLDTVIQVFWWQIPGGELLIYELSINQNQIIEYISRDLVSTPIL